MFIFKFQKALEFKQKEEDAAQREYQKSLDLLEREQNKLKEIKNSIDETLKKYENSKKGRIDIKQLTFFESYLNRLKTDYLNQDEICEILKKKTQHLFENFLELRKERKILVKLKEKQFADYEEKERKDEAKMLDELSNNMFNRR